MTSQGTRKSTNPKCAKVGCITESCPNKRPPQSEDGFCVDYDNGEKRSAVRVGGKQRNE